MTATTKTARPPHGLIFQLDDFTFQVESSQGNKYYIVKKYGVASPIYACNCPAHKPCKHIAGVQKFEVMSAHLGAARKERDIARF